MTTAAEFIAALNGRQKRLSIRPQSPGHLPPGWQSWLDAQPDLNALPRTAPPAAWVEVFARRPIRGRPRSPPYLTRLQAIGHMLRQGWAPSPREERPLRVGVTVFDILLHIVLVSLLLWLMYLRFVALSGVQEDGDVVQVEFIGVGNADVGGGALANAGAESAPTAAPQSSRSRESRPQATPAPQPRPTSTAAPPPSPAKDVARDSVQPVQVTETPAPEPESWQLPPPTPVELRIPQVELREPQRRQQVEEIAVLKPQAVPVLQPKQAQVELRAPELREQLRALDLPALPTPMPVVQVRSVPDPAPRQAELRVPQARSEVKSIPMPPAGNPVAQPGAGAAVQASAQARGAGGERGTAPAAGSAAASTGAGAKPAEQGGRGVTAAGAGAGPAPKAAPGGWPGAAKSDDWGASKRNVAGTGNGDGLGGQGDGKPGLFDDDGRVRLPDDWSQGRNIDLDRAGSWLQRPGLEYRGTRFDKYWIPQGTLLEEWVRRGIKTLSIPIPGTNRKLQCVVSVLQLGGGCLPVSDDVNEQPAVARPPPNVPFKPELQEDNGSATP